MSTEPAIVHLIPGLPVGGAENALAQLVEATAGRGYRHIVVSLQDEGTVEPRLRAAGAEVVGLGISRSSPNPLRLLPLVRLLRRTPARLLMTWLYHADVVGTLAGRLAPGLPVVWNVRCSALAPEQSRGLVAWETRFLARFSRLPLAVVSNSQAAIDFHKRLGYAPREWRLIPNGIDSARFRPDLEARSRLRAEWSIADDAPAFGFVGRLDPTKNHKGFLEAAALTAERMPSARFVLIGRGVGSSNAEAMQMVEEAGLAGRVRLLGERPDMPECYGALDAVVCASLGESFPNVLAEAMSCGVPCISTDVGDAGIIVGDAGRIVPLGDTAALAEAMVGFARMPTEERAKLGRQGRERIVDRYSLQRYADSYCQLFATAGAR